MEFRFTMMKYDCSKTEPKQNTRGEKTKEMIKVNTSTCWENADQGQTQPKLRNAATMLEICRTGN